MENPSVSTPLEKLDNSLRDVFETDKMEVSVIDHSGGVIVEDKTDEENLEIDSNHVRANMYSLLQQGSDALQYALELAKQSDSPRAFEVVGTLMKNLSDMNVQLLDTHERKQKLKGKKEDAQPQKVVNNSIVFNGSTAELNKMLSSMRKES